MKRIVIALGTTLLVAGCSQNPPPLPPAPPVAVDLNNPLMAPGYLSMAGSSDQFEIQSGQLALQMSQNPAVRNFAQMLITDHTRTTQQLMAAASAAGLAPPPPMLLPQHQQMLDQLRMAGPSFDLAFRDAQINAHQQALMLHQNYAASGDVPALRAAAAGAVPIIQQHLALAQGLQVMAPPPPPPPMQAPRSPGERG